MRWKRWKMNHVSIHFIIDHLQSHLIISLYHSFQSCLLFFEIQSTSQNQSILYLKRREEIWSIISVSFTISWSVSQFNMWYLSHNLPSHVIISSHQNLHPELQTEHFQISDLCDILEEKRKKWKWKKNHLIIYHHIISPEFSWQYEMVAKIFRMITKASSSE